MSFAAESRQPSYGLMPNLASGLSMEEPGA
jgi:hypothetical protein